MSAYDQNMTTSTLEIRLLAVILRHHARRALRWKTSAGDYWSHPPLSTPSPARTTHDAKRSYAQLDRLQYTFSPRGELWGCRAVPPPTTFPSPLSLFRNLGH